MRIFLLIITVIFYNQISYGQVIKNKKLVTEKYNPKDTLYTCMMPIETGAKFKGGSKKWKLFLEQNINDSSVAVLQDSTSFAKFGKCQTAIVQFKVCKDGSLCDYKISNIEKVSATVANEALNIIRKSPKCIPSKRNGTKVESYYSQPITFIFEED